jgi:hypothetical protein
VVLLSPSVDADDCRRIQNILVLFDASGFMKQGDRYDKFLKQMENFKNAMPLTADGFFDVGLRHYGLKVGMGCRNTESILGIEPWDPERFINAFPRHVSYGVSALSAGLRASGDEIAATSGKSVILLIGGGIESCKSDPVKIADRLAFNNPDLEIHTFQIGDSQEGKFFLEGIARKCRGSYQNISSMGTVAGWHAWMRKYLLIPCPAPEGLAAPREIPPIIFDYNSMSVRSKDPNLDASNLKSLDIVGKHLQANRQARVVLHGFTDGKGKQAYNLKLSRRRAEAVARVLKVQYGIPDARIGIIAHGTAPGGPPGEILRRVEFEIFQ